MKKGYNLDHYARLLHRPLRSRTLTIRLITPNDALALSNFFAEEPKFVSNEGDGSVSLWRPTMWERTRVKHEVLKPTKERVSVFREQVRELRGRSNPPYQVQNYFIFKEKTIIGALFAYWRRGRLNFGFFLASKYRNKGYMAEAKTCFIYGLYQQAKHWLTLEHIPDGQKNY